MRQIVHEGNLIALILRASYDPKGVEFLTPNEFSQQLAIQRREKGETIRAHTHNPVPRNVVNTLEVLWIREGAVRVDLYTEDRTYLESAILRENDVILLASGGHGFEVLEECVIVEVKQGPYAGVIDKSSFDGIDPSRVKLIDP